MRASHTTSSQERGEPGDAKQLAGRRRRDAARRCRCALGRRLLGDCLEAGERGAGERRLGQGMQTAAQREEEERGRRAGQASGRADRQQKQQHQQTSKGSKGTAAGRRDALKPLSPPTACSPRLRYSDTRIPRREQGPDQTLGKLHKATRHVPRPQSRARPLALALVLARALDPSEAWPAGSPKASLARFAVRTGVDELVGRRPIEGRQTAARAAPAGRAMHGISLHEASVAPPSSRACATASQSPFARARSGRPRHATHAGWADIGVHPRPPQWRRRRGSRHPSTVGDRHAALILAASSPRKSSRPVCANLPPPISSPVVSSGPRGCPPLAASVPRVLVFSLNSVQQPASLLNVTAAFVSLLLSILLLTPTSHRFRLRLSCRRLVAFAVPHQSP